jgi:hypothetical protein
MSQSSSPLPYALPAQQNNDIKHLDLLAIFHWIWGGLIMLFSLAGIIYIVIGAMVLNGSLDMDSGRGNRTGDDLVFGWVFLILGIAVILLGWTVGLLNIYSGFCLKKHRKRTFCIVIAAIDCLSFPIGTTLGVFTIVVLVRDSVKALYAAEGDRHVTA